MKAGEKTSRFNGIGRAGGQAGRRRLAIPAACAAGVGAKLKKVKPIKHFMRYSPGVSLTSQRRASICFATAPSDAWVTGGLTALAEG
jgi:hypothetical protein